MKLCEHIVSIYCCEIKHGNQPLYVSTPKYVDNYATASIYVVMKNRLQTYNLDGIEEYRYMDYHFPKERYFGCKKCGHYISGPMDEKQPNWYKSPDSNLVNEHVIATADNVFIEEGVYGKQMVPAFCSKKNS